MSFNGVKNMLNMALDPGCDCGAGFRCLIIAHKTEPPRLCVPINGGSPPASKPAPLCMPVSQPPQQLPTNRRTLSLSHISMRRLLVGSTTIFVLIISIVLGRRNFYGPGTRPSRHDKGIQEEEKPAPQDEWSIRYGIKIGNYVSTNGDKMNVVASCYSSLPVANQSKEPGLGGEPKGRTGKLLRVRGGSHALIGSVRFMSHSWNTTANKFDSCDLDVPLEYLSLASFKDLMGILGQHFDNPSSQKADVYIHAMKLLEDMLESATLSTEDQTVLGVWEKMKRATMQNIAHESRNSLLRPLSEDKIRESMEDARIGSYGGFYRHHFYERLKQYRQPDIIPKTQKAKQSTSFQAIADEMSLWPELRRESNAHQEVLYGSTFALSHIWAHQHPPKDQCKHARYMIAYTGLLSRAKGNYGIGALFHILASNLALAMSLDRILVIGTDDKDIWVNASGWPENSNCRSLQCYFLPFSSCSMEDALQGDHADDLGPKWYMEDQSESLEKVRVLLIVGENGYEGPPPQFADILRDSPIQEKQYIYWWRAQAVTFFLRPSVETRKELSDRRMRMFSGHSGVPEGSISLHVRHGDKYIESNIRPLRDYVSAASMIADTDARYSMRRIFISTEDPEVIEEAEKLADRENGGYKVMFTEYERKNLPVVDLAEHFGGSNEMLNGLLNLQLAVMCDGWVCTLTSNWCQLIDSLRSTVAEKSASLFVDIEANWRYRIIEAL